MPTLNKGDEAELKKYADFVRNKEHASALQDLNWAFVKNKEWRGEAVYLEKNGNITVAMSLLIRTFVKGFSIIYAPRGPVCDTYDLQTVKELIEEKN